MPGLSTGRRKTSLRTLRIDSLNVTRQGRQRLAEARPELDINGFSWSVFAMPEGSDAEFLEIAPQFEGLRNNFVPAP